MNDPRHEIPRFIRVSRIDSEGVVIVTVKEDGTPKRRSRYTDVRRDRFGGTKRGNYAFVGAE